MGGKHDSLFPLWILVYSEKIFTELKFGEICVKSGASEYHSFSISRLLFLFYLVSSLPSQSRAEVAWITSKSLTPLQVRLIIRYSSTRLNTSEQTRL